MAFGGVVAVGAAPSSGASNAAAATAQARKATTTTSSVPISTTTTSTTVPPSGTPIDGVGTSVIDPAMGAWASALGHASVPERINYVGGGDSNAEPTFAANNFAVDGGPSFLANEFSLLPQTQKLLAGAGQRVAYAPVAATGLSFVFALRLEKCIDGQPSDQPDTQLTSLNVTPDILAGMFLGQSILNDGSAPNWKYAVVNWNTQAILSLNPTLRTDCSTGSPDVLAGGTEDEAIFPIGRQDAAPENQALATFFAQAAPTVWSLYLSLTKNTGYIPSDEFPWDASNLTSNGYLAQNESAQLADLVGGNNDAFPTPYSQTVTYMTTSDLAKEQAQFAAAGLTPALVNLVPNSVTALPDAQVTPIGPTIRAVGSALAGLKANPDGTVKADYSFSNPAVWPIPVVTYLVVPTNHLSSKAAALLAELVNFAVSATGQSDLGPLAWPGAGTDGASAYGYTPLTGPLQSYADAATAVATAVASEGLPPPRPAATTTTTSPPTGQATTSGASGQPVTPEETGSASGFGSSGLTGSGSGVSSAGLESGQAGGGVATAGGAPPDGSSGPAGAGSLGPVRFVAEGSPVPDHPTSSLLDETYGTAGPWLLVLGSAGLATGLWLRRRDRLAGGRAFHQGTR
jgi:hypothetical protein